MKIIKFVPLALLFFFTLNIKSQNIVQKDLSVTVYNNNLGVVKDVREMDLTEGLSVISITNVAKLIDPTSVHIKFEGEVIEQNYQYDLVSLDKILQKYIDREIRLVSESNELVEGKLLSALGNQVVLEKRDGGLLMIPNISKYRFSVEALPEGLITKPTLVWQINSKNSGDQDIEISYQTQGMNWHAEYVAVLNEDDTKLDLNSWVSVDNKSGTTYKDAKLKLVAGDVNRVQERRRIYKGREQIEMMAMTADQTQFEEKEFFEYHIYNLQRPTTLAQNETKQISLFESDDVDANKKYFYRSTGSNSKGKINVIVEFSNKEEQNLGVPMPKGKVRVYKSDGESIEFVGEDLIDHTPKNEEIKLKIGDAFDILAEETQLDHKKITNRVYEKTYEVKIKNRKNEKIDVEVERYLGYNWEVLESSLKYTKKNAQTITFIVPVNQNDDFVLTYKVRYSN